MADKKMPWGKIALVGFAALCVLPIVLWVVAFQKGDRLYDQTKAEWTVLCSRLVEQSATVEEVKAAFRAEGKDPIEELPKKQYDGTVSRHCVTVFFNELEPASWMPRNMAPTIYFDEAGVAIEYELFEGGTGF